MNHRRALSLASALGLGLIAAVLIWTGAAASAQAVDAPLSIVEQMKLTAADGTPGDWFGAAGSVAGDLAIIGAPDDDPTATDSGSVYVFYWDGSQWSEQAKLTASDGAAGDHFGTSVAISGTIALVGAPHDDDGGRSTGSVYVFSWDGASWSEQTKLTASDREVDDRFGTAVSLSNDMVLVGAPNGNGLDADTGAAYLFVWNESAWVETKVYASDGVQGDGFGGSVSISGDYAMIGAPGADGSSGRAYIFARQGSSWVEQKLVPGDGEADDRFGAAVSIAGHYAVVGAPGGDGQDLDTGSAYVFQRAGPTWLQREKLRASDGEVGDEFGGSVSLSGNRALVGAPNGNGLESNSGSAYFFFRDGNSWLERKLMASDGQNLDYLGTSVALSGDHALVGAPCDDEGGACSGSVYAYRLLPDLSISKTAKPTFVASGDPITYTLRYSNVGLNVATGVVITDLIPSALTLVTHTNVGPVITPTAGITYVWQVADLRPGKGGIITITGIIDPSMADVFSLTNRATITTTAIDEDPGNNTATVITFINAVPPLPPILISPPNGAILPDTTPTLSWHASPSPNVTGYLLDWNGTVLDVGDVTQHTPSPLANGVYTWTVAAYDLLGATSPTTDVWSFVVSSHRVYLPLVMRNAP